MSIPTRYYLRFYPILSICVLMFTIHAPSGQSRAIAQTTTGTIAYMRINEQTGNEIWLIEPDGSNNRRIWAAGEPDTNGPTDIPDLDWRPDSAELAFSSDHEFACSLFDADIYAIKPDGSGYRRITNGPNCAALASYAKGAVTVTVRNFSTRNPLFVYVQGAPVVQSVLVSQGDSATVTFTDVADFGAEFLQQAVVIWGDGRWLAPIALADVKPGQTIHAGTINVAGEGTADFGAYVPSWHSDGSRLGYILTSAGSMYGVAANPPAGAYGEPLLNLAAGTVPSSDVMDWGPTPALANQILYYSLLGQGIFRVTEGSDDVGEKIIETGIDQVIDVQWLPDGTGFLYTRGNRLNYANVYHYDLATGVETPLTTFTDEYAIDVTVSPDGEWIVFERSPTNTFAAGDLWKMRRDGTELRLLVQNGMRPSWSSQAPQIPSTLPAKGYLPLLKR